MEPVVQWSLNGRDFQNTAARFANNISVIGLPLYGIYAFDDRGIYGRQSDVPSYYEDGVKKYLRGEGSAYYRAGDRIITDMDGNGQIYNYGTLAEDLQMMIREKAVDGFDGGLVVGFSLMVALLLSFAPDEALNSIPALIRPIVGNGFVMGVITVLILEHLIFRSGKKAKKE